MGRKRSSRTDHSEQAERSYPTTGSAVDPCPLAAFRVGYICRVLDIDDDAFGDRLQRLRESLWIASDEMTPKVYLRLHDVIRSVEDLPPLRGSVKEGDALFEEFTAIIFPTIEYARRTNLASFRNLADTAFTESSRCRIWYELGSSLGEYVRNSHLQKGRAPSLRTLIEGISRLPENQREPYPVLQQLLTVNFTGHKLSDLRKVIRQQINLPPKAFSSIGFAAMFEAIFSVIEEQLQAVPPVQATTNRRETLSIHSGERNGFMPSPLQSAILKALTNRALKKQPLATEACGGEGTRLYRKNGIKELIEHGFVSRQDGVGYYRPDAPPADYIIPQKPH